MVDRQYRNDSNFVEKKKNASGSVDARPSVSRDSDVEFRAKAAFPFPARHVTSHPRTGRMTPAVNNLPNRRSSNLETYDARSGGGGDLQMIFTHARVISVAERRQTAEFRRAALYVT